MGELQKTFGAAVRRVRTARGIAQEAMAADLGYDRSYYGKIERGERNLSFRAAEELAEALGVPVVDLLCTREHHDEERPGAAGGD